MKECIKIFQYSGIWNLCCAVLAIYRAIRGMNASSLLSRTASRCQRAYILPLWCLFSTSTLWGHWTDLNQTWTYSLMTAICNIWSNSTWHLPPRAGKGGKNALLGPTLNFPGDNRFGTYPIISGYLITSSSIRSVQFCAIKYVHCVDWCKQPANVRQLPPIHDGLLIIIQGYIWPNANTFVFSDSHIQSNCMAKLSFL